MNIKQAKEQVIQTVRAYLKKDEHGDWAIPLVAQRPILLMGPPGVGKTAIAQQAAQECGVALVSYTITHHTRQSAIGLPSIRTASYRDKTFSVTEYTMSEIIASVYRAMEETGLETGILFLDEVNCVSETLAPAMLQFLQCKTFGSHRLPEGWVIVAAGNSPEYNRSVRDFDVVTLDRVRRLDIQASYQPWKEYAYLRRVHPAVLAYLELKPRHFYQLETTVDGKRFATARGWEDLSRLIAVNEELDIPTDEQVVSQYIQHPVIAKDFANYYDLYRKYQSDYDVEAILSGHLTENTVDRLRTAPFDERLSALSLVLDALFRSSREANEEDAYVTALHQRLKKLIGALESGVPAPDAFAAVIGDTERAQAEKRRSGLLTQEEHLLLSRILDTLSGYRQAVRTAGAEGGDAAGLVRSSFREAVAQRKAMIETGSLRLDRAFALIEAAFGEGQELVIFLTELTMNPYSMKFISDNGNAKFSGYNQALLLGGRSRAILDELE
ncbi:MAG: AAA family ATPase [Oscillospiraceae bacterium]|nr:AAA family ATPase [Oscillospiraceae bacterium]